jgi:hypothetical protein
MAGFKQGKRLRELAKRQKREDKLARKLQRRNNPNWDASTNVDAPNTREHDSNPTPEPGQGT